jgi:ABC-type nitrate/sulfonate/bicarbonate transport system permease component
VALLFWAAVWALASARVGKELILPSPLDVVRKLAELGATGPFWLSAGRSLLNVLSATPPALPPARFWHF